MATSTSADVNPSIISHFWNNDSMPYYASGFLGLISAVAFGALGMPLFGIALAGTSCVAIIAGMVKGHEIFKALPMCVAAVGVFSIMARAFVFAVRG